jgi:hypothetical protein
MKIFQEMEIEKAVAYSLEGGQALHLHRIIPDPARAPRCFVNAVKRGDDIAHLFDQDYKRLHMMAHELGVNIVVIERMGTENQHVDLCGSPLKRAIKLCKDV